MKYLLTLISVVLLYSSCVKDRVLPSQSVTVIPGSTLIDYWNFNNISLPITTPTFTIGGGNLQFGFDTVSDTAGYYDITAITPNQNINAQNGDSAGNALRVRNPCSNFIIVAPTTGYKNIVVSYAVAKTTNGASTDSVFYTTDGITYTNAGLSTLSYEPQVDPDYTLETFNLSSINAINNNANFKFKITFSAGNLNTSGNDRFDNITVTGVSISGSGSGIPVIANASSVTGTENAVFADTIVASNTPTSFHVTGTLPPGLSVDTTKGIISGTPTTAGTFVDTIQATNAQGTGIQILTITINAPGVLTLLDYWNFNNISIAIPTPTSTIGGGNLLFDFTTVSDTTGYDDLLVPVVPTTNINAQNGDPAGNALRVRNPCLDFIIVAPTTGYKNIVLSYSVAKSTSGASTDSVYYTTDGTHFINTGLSPVVYNPSVDPDYMLETFDFSSILAVNNNPNFQFKITFSDGNLATSGNDRFDNITVEGYPQ